MILEIRFRRAAVVASVLLTGATQAQAFGAVPGVFPPQAPSSVLAMPSGSSASTVSQAKASGG